ncbi:MAG TPA: hypothetical protein VGI45_11990 [Terracidiphilus sp.]|jgi:hypothetical protein
MQLETEQNISNLTEHEQVSLYRTQWLMAHNRLHDLAQSHPDLKGDWDSYLRDLQSSEAASKSEA